MSEPRRLGPAGRLARAWISSKLTPLLICAALLIGAFAVWKLPREEEPQIIVPMIDVFVQMPGASAREVEERVTKPMEKLLWEVPGVEYIYSTSSPGSSMAVVRFFVGQDEEKSIVRLNQKMSANFDLIPPGAKDVQTLLEAAVVGQRNLLLTGDASALPSLATALAALVPAGRRVVSIGGPLARARAGWMELQPAGDVGALVRVAASFRAEHLLVGELVGAEVADLLLAAARGQEGLVIAMPSRSAAEGLARVEALTLPALGSGAGAAAPLVSSTIELVVHVVANADGSARIVDISEPKVDGGRTATEAVITWRSESGRKGGGAGKLAVAGVSARLAAALASAGQSLPSSLVRR